MCPGIDLNKCIIAIFKSLNLTKIIIQSIMSKASQENSLNAEDENSEVQLQVRNDAKNLIGRQQQEAQLENHDAILLPMNFQIPNNTSESLKSNSFVGRLGNKSLRNSSIRQSDLKLTRNTDSKNDSSRPMLDIPVIESNMMQQQYSVINDYSTPSPKKKQETQQKKQQFFDKKQQSKTQNLRKKIEKQPQAQKIKIQQRIQQYIKNGRQSSFLPTTSSKKISQTKKNNQQVEKFNKKLYSAEKIEKGKILPRYLQPIIRQPQRQAAVKATTQFLSGKLSIIWIFVIRQDLTSEQIRRIKNIYCSSSNLDEDDDSFDDKYVPLCKYSWEMEELLKVPNAFFKVVTDIPNSFGVFNFRSKKEIFQFYIYNNQRQTGFTHAINFKCVINKVKGIQHQLDKLLTRAEQQIQNQLQMYKMKDKLVLKKGQRKFPSFLRLSGKDKTQATLYRSNLYGALKITLKERKKYYDHFMKLVQQRYGKNENQAQNIEEYEDFNHLQDICNLDQSRQIIKFYIKQSFYYGILNSMLRTMKTTEQFNYCILPFNQMYYSIKMFYQNDLLPTRKLPKMTLYRGTKLKPRDFNFLKPGVFIEMFGFMSTSKKQQTALKFADTSDSYIFVIHINEITIGPQNDKYDHGFVDINKYNLAGKFSYEEEVLFNALNIFRVVKIEYKKDYHYIHLEYGVIFDLLKKKKDKLTVDENDVLINYKYCTSMQDKIQDHGDVLLIANQFEQSKKYYQQIIKQDSNNANAYLKLAQVQQQCGQITQAEKNANISLQKTTTKVENYDRQTALKVFGIHTLNAQINLDSEDFFAADENLEKAISILEQGLDDFERAKKYRQLGQCKFKRGQIKEAQEYLAKSQAIFKNLLKSLQDKKWDINKEYYKRLLTFLCLGPSYTQISQLRQMKLRNVEDTHEKILAIQEQLNMELLKLNKAQQDVFQYAENKQQYEKCVKKAIEYLNNIKQEQTQDPHIKAQKNVIKATVKGYTQLAQSQKLLNEAIQLVQSADPYHLNVAQYSKILGKIQKVEVEKFNNPILHIEPDQSGKIPYNEKQRIQTYEKSKINYQKAIHVLMYHNKTQISTEILSIKNDLIELDFNQGKFASCEQIIKQTKQAAKTKQYTNTELAKANMMMGKISLARGEIKKAFEATEQAYKILRKALVKKQEQRYQAVFQHSDVHLNIVILKSKIYQKQLKFDLSLKQIKSAEVILHNKFKDESHTLFAEINEEYANYFIGIDQIQDFDDYYEKALRIREQQMGQINLPNAITRCKYACHLLLTHDVDAAREQLQKAMEIFSKLSEQNPIIWIVEYTDGVIYQYQKDLQQATSHYRKSLDLAQKKLDPTHINVCKMQFTLGKSYANINKFDQAFQLLESLSGTLVDSLNHSPQQFEQIIDDEKLALTKNVFQTLTESSLRQSMASQDIRTTAAANQRKQIYEQKMNVLRKTYNFLGQ